MKNSLDREGQEVLEKRKGGERILMGKKHRVGEDEGD